MEDTHAEGGVVQSVDLLFIHHSCGGQLLAEPGPRIENETSAGQRCIYISHPNGGGLRASLEMAGFRVHEASYGSLIGEDTDSCHWRATFSDHMDRLLRTAHQDSFLPEGRTNSIVVFKSCFPNNQFVGRGEEPGATDSCELTVANARAAYRALLPLFERHLNVLFIAVTAPAMAEPTPRRVKQRIMALFQRPPQWAKLAREFNSWLADPTHGWLSSYGGGNVKVFDYYDILTRHGESDWLLYPTHNGRNSHPSREGNQLASEAFVPFLLDAWQGLQSAELGRSQP